MNGPSLNARRAYGACCLVSLAMIAVALRRWAAVEVRTDLGELVLLIFVGAVWLLVATLFFPWLGLSVRDDAVERRNGAALVALCGAEVGAAILYAGGNLGEGPSYWNNVFSVAVATGGWVGLWVLLDLGGRVSISITEERDLAAGLRLCGFLLASGLVLGRAVAGDWHSEAATLHDLARDGWPVAGLCALAVVVERFARPRPARPFPPWRLFGLLPALFYLGVALVWLGHLGRWEGMPR